jgi:hypothetical protein
MLVTPLAASRIGDAADSRSRKRLFHHVPDCATIFTSSSVFRGSRIGTSM